MRDSQRSRVYAWERSQSWWQIAARGSRYTEVPSSVVRPLSLPECEAYLSRVLHKAGAWPVEVVDGRGSRAARALAWRIALPVFGRTRPVMLHEAAHAIAAQRGRDDKHGPQFVRIYIDLLVRHLHLSAGALLKSARAAGVKVAPRNRTRSVIS